MGYLEKLLAEMTDAAIFALQLGKRSVGQGVKTPPFHGGITGSIPVRSTEKALQKCEALLFSAD